MIEQALSTLPREAKGPLAPPRMLGGAIQPVADAVAAWPEVEATAPWHLHDQSRVDGIDFYVGAEELGHIHLDGSKGVAVRHRSSWSSRPAPGSSRECRVAD